ncbi:1670_t:CDS:2 [Funneliformis geosporum]|uniref:18831_t:CDS:1 n=1 Tax=Funneliformis geosporum TaxID=1117311 RepID=A0A9W4WNC5_9GLOM|nr:18831_t:CDS:2 [Funneliformis geosporum]CAI2181625.1 1670_t:CDS:2 [Funneliformis geosporum]
MPNCLYCSEYEQDLDPDGRSGEYCSDDCRRKALTSGFTKPCIHCKEFAKLESSQYCGWFQCRNVSKCTLKCMTCKENDVTVLNSLWCSKRCRNKTPNWKSLVKSQELCLKCKEVYAPFKKDFCAKCEEWVNWNGPCVFKLSKTSEKYEDVSNQFENSWKHVSKVLPRIHTIYKLFLDEQIKSQYNEHRENIEKLRKLEGRPFPKGDGKRLMTKGNEQRRFHGTIMECLLGIETDTLCSNLKCAVCGIITEGYKLEYAKSSRFGCQKFGEGIYFSGTSSKSDDFNGKSLKIFEGIKYKVMFLNKVIVGRTFELIQADKSLTGPPKNYDSVVGEPGSLLNYDELVVYNESACIPQYLIVYEKSKKIKVKNS